MTWHYDDVIIGTIASQITCLTSVYSTVYSGAYQSKHQSSASLAFVWGIHRGPVNSPHKWPVTRKMFPFDDVIMETLTHHRPFVRGIYSSPAYVILKVSLVLARTSRRTNSQVACDIMRNGTHVTSLWWDMTIPVWWLGQNLKESL